MNVVINADQSVAIQDAEGLDAILSGALGTQVNALDLVELWAVLFAMRANPYPANGTGEAYFGTAVELVRTNSHLMGKVSIGNLRAQLVRQAWGSNGAPADIWIDIAEAYALKKK